MAKIILIEDNEPLRALIAASLQAVGHEVWQTGDAGEALAEAEQRPADIVLTDLMVPNCPALETLIAKCTSGAASELIVMSGSPHSPLYMRMAQQLGWSRMLLKPFRVGTLLEVIDRVLANRRHRGSWAELRGRTAGANRATAAG